LTVVTGANVGDACGLLTQAEVADALGEAVGEGQGASVGSQAIAPGLTAAISSCAFDSTTSARSVSVNMSQFSGVPASQVLQFAKSLLCAGKEEVSGLGDFACWYDADHRELQAVKSLTFIDLNLIELQGPDRTGALQGLAAKALARLP
jgi:hypothetical protein